MGEKEAGELTAAAGRRGELRPLGEREEGAQRWRNHLRVTSGRRRPHDSGLRRLPDTYRYSAAPGMAVRDGSHPSNSQNVIGALLPP